MVEESVKRACINWLKYNVGETAKKAGFEWAFQVKGNWLVIYRVRSSSCPHGGSPDCREEWTLLGEPTRLSIEID